MHETTATPAEDDPAAAPPVPAVPDPGWTWPPPGPAELAGTATFTTETWAPPTAVRHPVVRIGRWTLLYRRARPRRTVVARGVRALAGLLAARLTGWSRRRGRWRRAQRR